MNQIEELIDSFVEHLRLLTCSKRTIKNHRWSLDKFLAFLRSAKVTAIHDITRDHIIDYQRYRHYYQNRFHTHDSAFTQNRHLISVKQFFRYLKEEGFLAHDPTHDIHYAKEPRQLPKTALTNTEIKKLLRRIDTSTLLGFRDRTIFELLYSTGIRRNELLNLTVSDIDYEEGFLRVNHGKGDKDRVTPIGKIACQYLETYIKGIRPLLLKEKDEQALFLSQRKQKLTDIGLQRIIRHYADVSKLNKHITTHTFRRSCATEMIRRNANLMHVKELLGHSSIDTVQTYCNLAITDLKEAHRKCHPRERDTE